MSGSQQAFTETWWGSRWIQALRRFGRGWPRSLANARGATQGIHDLNISPGCIEAVVPGENGESFQLRILLRTLPDATWQRILRRLAGKALYAAKLLSGEMPRDIERVFSQSRASLFPRRQHEVEVSCSCDQADHPCGHVAAAQFVLAEAFDRDPFLLLELRGRSRDQVLAALREIRGAGASTDRAGADAFVDEDEDARVQPRPEDYTVAGEDLATLGFHIAAPEVPVGAIRAMGPPRSWSQPLAVLKAFVPLYRAASAVALDIAWSGEEEIPFSARLPEPASEVSLIAMAESMAAPTSTDDLKPPSRRRGKRGGRRRRGRRGKAGGAQPVQGSPRRRKRGGKKGPSKGAAKSATQGSADGGGGDGSPEQGGRKRRRRRRGGRRRRRGGGGGGEGGGGGGGDS